MSVTTGTGAKKTAGTDNWRTIIGVHNDTVDVYDEVKAAAAIFASAYDSTATYAAGDQCTHDGKWYVANQAISTAEDWTPAHWTEITIASKLDTANVYNGLDKTASGFALDARQGKSLNEAIATLSNKSPTASSNPEIPNNADLNSYTTPGAYTVVSDASASTISNMPRNASGKLIVMYRPNSNYLTQIYFTSSSLFLTYSRNYNNGTWTAWVQLAYFEQGTWTPHIYDYETYVRAMDVQPYFKIGGLYIMTASQYDVDFSGISTMLEIRNLPCTNLLCGEIFIQNIKASSIAQGIGRGIQPSGAYAYIRSNLKSDDLTSTTLTGRTTLLLIGL